MTEAMQKAFDFIKEYIERHGYSPGYRDIMKGLGYKSTAPAKAVVDHLVERGKIGRLWGKHRSLYIIEDGGDPARTRALEACRLLVDAHAKTGKANPLDVFDAYVVARAALAWQHVDGTKSHVRQPDEAPPAALDPAGIASDVCSVRLVRRPDYGANKVRWVPAQ